LYRKRQSNITKYYSVDGDVVYCNNIQELMEELQIEHAPEQWRLFVDLSKGGLKAVLRHNGNKFSSIPQVHPVHMKEVCENLQVLLQKMCCEEHGWNMCAVLKVLAMLTGLQGRYTKFCCFVCDWDCQAIDSHYRIKKNGHSIQKQHQVRRIWHILL
jgi:hypothetical protein